MDFIAVGSFCVFFVCMFFVCCFYSHFDLNDQDADEQRDLVKYENDSDEFIPFAVRVKVVPACRVIMEEKSSLENRQIFSINEKKIISV